MELIDYNINKMCGRQLDSFCVNNKYWWKEKISDQNEFDK